MSCLLKLRHLSGERTNEVVRSVAVVIVTVHLQRRELPWVNNQVLVSHRNVFLRWNLERFFQVAGAEHLQRNRELLPGGTQVVLHHLHTHSG